jgi:hypothetical protein
VCAGGLLENVGETEIGIAFRRIIMSPLLFSITSQQNIPIPVSTPVGAVVVP